MVTENLETINEQKKFSETETEKNTQLDFSQRKDRFVVVTAVMGVLVVVLKSLMSISIASFERLYLHSVNVFGADNLFISCEHVLTTIYISSCILIIGAFLVYCVWELCNFQSVEKRPQMEAKADTWYCSVFKIAVVLLLCNAVISGCAVFVFSEEKITFYVILFFLAVLVIILFVMAKKDIRLILQTIVVHILLSFLIFLTLFSVTYNVDGKLITYFEDERIVLEFHGMYYPDEVKCIICFEDGIGEEEYLFSNCGETAWIEKISANEKGKDESTVVKENYYCYKYEINIAGLYGRGSNIIDIVFSINNKEYHIRNTFEYNEDFRYTEGQMQIDL